MLFKQVYNIYYINIQTSIDISDPDTKSNIMDNIGKQFGNHLTISTEPLSRSRASSMNEDGDQKFEEELFNKCKQNEGDQKATSGVLLHVGFSTECP